MTKSIGISDYWFQWLNSIVASGIRHSKAQVVSEALARHRRALEQEKAEFEDARAQIKERRERNGR